MTDKELRDKWLQLHRDPNARNCLRHEIKNSWDRCTARKVNPFLRENPYMCTASELTRHQAQAGFLIKASSSVMDNMFEFVAGTGFVVALADSALCVVKVIGDEESLAFAKKANLLEGTIWSEELVGTNAGALAYNLGRPISVFGYEHFCLFSHVAACSCAPIIDQGRIIGVLGMIAPFNRVSNHTLGIVVGAAKHIKYKLVMERAYNYHEVLMDSIQEGLFALDANGNITYVNEKCERTLQLSRESLLGRNIRDVLSNDHNNLDFINKVVSGRRVTDENVTLIIGSEVVQFNVTCSPLNSSDPDYGGVVVLVKENQRIKRLVRNIISGGAKMTFEDIIGRNHEFLKCLNIARSASPSMSNVLLLGESGTGKDIIAQAMHNASPRKNYPYLAINCAALPRELIGSELFGYEEGAFTGARKGGQIGKFELADQGTIFLDEIGDMPLDLQASLLRVLEEKTIMRLGGSRPIAVNVRVIAATNQDLEAMIANHRFRRDLFYRLGVIRITLPPLRKRPDDIYLLVQFFMENICRRFNKPPMTLAPELMEKFLQYDWPGNIREMQNVIEGAVQLASGDVIGPDLLSSYFPPGKDGSPIPARKADITSNPEMQKIMECLEKHKYNKTKAASDLGMSRRTLYRRLNEYRLIT